jgi:hypothetical protein
MLVVVIGGSEAFALVADAFAAVELAGRPATSHFEDAREAAATAASRDFRIGFRRFDASRVLLPIVAWTIMWLSVGVAAMADAPLAQEVGAGSVVAAAVMPPGPRPLRAENALTASAGASGDLE